MYLLLAPAPRGWIYLSGYVSRDHWDHGASWRTSPREKTCSWTKRRRSGLEFLQSSVLRGAVNQQRSLRGWRREMVEVRSACTRVLLASSQALESSRGSGAKPKGWVVGAGSNTRATGALKGGGAASQRLHCHSLPGSVFLALQLRCPSLVSTLLGCSYAWEDSAAPWVNLIFLLGICWNREGSSVPSLLVWSAEAFPSCLWALWFCKDKQICTQGMYRIN